MSIRFYLTPLIQAGKGREPKYFYAMTGLWWQLMPMGAESTALIVADVTPEQHAELSGYSDVTSIPADIDQTISSGALSEVRSALEGLNIPGNWVTTSDTYRQVMRTVAQFFQFIQRLNGITPTKLFTGRTLSTKWSDIPSGMRSNLQSAAESMGMDYSFVIGTTTVREILHAFADQWGDKPIYIAGVSL